MAGWAAAAQFAGNLFNTWYNSNSAKKAAAASYAYNIASMNHQYHLTRKLNQNAYQDTTYSMKQSGINPMLAINNGVNGLSAGSGANISQQAATSDIDLASALQLKNDTDRVDNDKARVQNETETKNSTVALNKAAENKSNQEAKATEISNTYAPKIAAAQIKALDAQATNNLQQGQSALIMARNNTNMTNSNISLNSAKGLETAANTKFTNERSRGFGDTKSVKLGPLQFSYSNTGNRPATPNQSSAVKYSQGSIGHGSTAQNLQLQQKYDPYGNIKP